MKYLWSDAKASAEKEWAYKGVAVYHSTPTYYKYMKEMVELEQVPEGVARAIYFTVEAFVERFVRTSQGKQP